MAEAQNFIQAKLQIQYIWKSSTTAFSLVAVDVFVN